MSVCVCVCVRVRLCVCVCVCARSHSQDVIKFHIEELSGVTHGASTARTLLVESIEVCYEDG